MTTRGEPATAPPPAEIVSDPLGLAVEFAAARLGVAPADIVQLGYEQPVLTVSGTRIWTGLFGARQRDDQLFVAVNMVTGEVLDQAGFRRLFVPARPRPTEEKFSPEARQRLAEDAQAPVLLAYLIGPVDFRSAARAFIAAHPEVAWDGESPIADDLATVRALRVGLMEAKSKPVAAAGAPFIAAAESAGAEVLLALELAPIVYVSADRARAEALAARSDVLEVLLATPFTPTMNIGRLVLRTDWSEANGFTGSGAIIGIVEYARVDYAAQGLAGAKFASRSVDPEADPETAECLTVPGWVDGSTVEHMTWVAGVAVSRHATYRGIAPSAKIIDASANDSPNAESADARILRAAECALLAGADVLSISAIQNSTSGRTTGEVFFDHVVFEHHVAVIASGGNHSQVNDDCADGVVVSPGSAWNVINVGGVDDHNSAASSDWTLWYRQDRFEPAYCFRDPPAEPWDSTNDRIKPELSAPAVSITAAGETATGVSAAVAAVAGNAALVLSQEDWFATQPEALKAVLLAASRTQRTPRPDGSGDTAKEGVGTASAKWSNLVVLGTSPSGSPNVGGYGRQNYYTGPEPQCDMPAAKSVSFYGNGGRNIRFLITWNSHTYWDLGNDTYDARIADFNLTIKKGSTTVGQSARVASNVEYVDFSTSQWGTGTYTATITPVRWGCEDERLGWAWVSYSVP